MWYTYYHKIGKSELCKLVQQLMNGSSHVTEDKRQDDAYNALVELFKTPNTDNTKILSAVINVKEDQLPLYHGTNKKRVCHCSSPELIFPPFACCLS